MFNREKSDDLLMYQFRLVEARLSGDRRNVGWLLRNAAYYRQRDMRPSDRYEPEWERSGWGEPRNTRYVNG